MKNGQRPRGIIEAVNRDVEFEQSDADARAQYDSQGKQPLPTTVETVCGGKQSPLTTPESHEARRSNGATRENG